MCEKNTAGPSSLSDAKTNDNTDKCKASAFSILNQQGGQAVTEYILVLVVVVAMILGGLYQVNSAFKVWAQGYFGDYLSCLLETGELPALGGSVSAAAGICNELYEPFSIENGRPLLASSSGSGGGSSSSSGSSKNNSDSSSSSSSSDRGVRDTGGGSSGSSQINPSARFGSSNRFQPNNESQSSKRSGSTYTGSTENSVPMSLLGPDSNGRIKMNDSGFLMDYGADIERDRKQIKSEAGSKKSEDSVQERGRKKAMPLRAPASKALEDKDEEMTFGSFLRYLIIAAIIIALVLVVGGQLLQISKSSGSD